MRNLRSIVIIILFNKSTISNYYLHVINRNAATDDNDDDDNHHDDHNDPATDDHRRDDHAASQAPPQEAVRAELQRARRGPAPGRVQQRAKPLQHSVHPEQYAQRVRPANRKTKSSAVGPAPPIRSL